MPSPVVEEPLVVLVQGKPGEPRTSSTSVLSTREIRSVPVRSADDVLQLVPGVTLVQHGSEGKGQQLFLRGFDALHGADFEVTVQGVPINEASNVHAQGYIDMGFVVPEAIRLVRVTKGPFSVRQGPFGMAGSASYKLGLPIDELGWRVGYGYGTTGRHRVLGTYAPHNRMGDDFVALEAVSDAGYGSNRSVQKANLLAHATVLDDAERGRLSLWSASYAAQFELPGTLRSEDVDNGRVAFFDTYDAEGRGASTRTLGAASYELAFASHFLQASTFAMFRHMDLLENFTGFLLDPVEGDRRRQRHDSVRWGLQVSDEVAWSRTVSTYLSGGAGYEVVSQSQEQLGQTLQVVRLEQQLQAAQASAHLALEGRLRLGQGDTPWLRLDAGARLDWQQVLTQGMEEAQWVGSPRVIAEVTPFGELSLFGAYGWGARPPEARAVFGYRPKHVGLAQDSTSSSAPAWSQSQSAELGARFQPSALVTGSVSAFFTAIARESIYDHVSGTSLELSSTQRMGTEVVLSLRPMEWWTLSADVTWARARFTASGNPVPFAPPLVVALRGIVSHGDGWHAGVHAVAIAARALPHKARGSATFQVDATLGYHWPKYRLDFGIENLLAQRMREGEYHYASRWHERGSTDELPALHFAAGAPLNARGSLTVLF